MPGLVVTGAVPRGKGSKSGRGGETAEEKARGRERGFQGQASGRAEASGGKTQGRGGANVAQAPGVQGEDEECGVVH